jgi:lysophospholipase L1-like esterase
MTTTRSLLALVCTLAVWVAMGGLASPGAQADGTYVALGDSVAAPPDSYVHVLFGALRIPEGGGLDRLYNRARGGEDSTTLRTNGQLATAIADIDLPSDTKVVTIDIGGNDRSICGDPAPSWHLSSCPFAANFDATLVDLQAALERDPGSESLVAMTYYNPASATGTPQEQDYDRGLLGTDLQLYCAPSGDPRLGLNDQLACVAASRGALVADVYPPFKAGGQVLLSGIHPTSRGQAVIAEEFSKTLGIPAPPPSDTAPPTLNLSGAASQNILPRRGVQVVARSPVEASTVTAKGTVRVRGGSQVFKLRSVTKQIARGARTTLTLKLRRRAFRAIASALRVGKRARAKITVTAKDAAGNVITKRRIIRLKR